MSKLQHKSLQYSTFQILPDFLSLLQCASSADSRVWGCPLPVTQACSVRLFILGRWAWSEKGIRAFCVLCELFIYNRSLSSFEPPGQQRILAPYSKEGPQSSRNLLKTSQSVQSGTSLLAQLARKKSVLFSNLLSPLVVRASGRWGHGWPRGPFAAPRLTPRGA